jgi:hypothetical protein
LIDRVELVEMRREGASYQWEAVHDVHLPTPDLASNS